MRARRIRATAVAAIAGLTLAAAACGDDANDSAATTAGGDTATTMAESMTTEAMTEESMSEGSMAEGAMMEPVGPACSSLPTEGEGSVDGMADDPAATAASNNPELSTLVAAVDAAGLVDTLNGDGPFTIFAPVNSAFEALPAGTVDALLADPTGDLTTILTQHVVPSESLVAEDLIAAGTVANVAEGELTITAEGDTVTVDAGGGPATVVCANVPVANGTVHLIDTVLLPAG
jgi:transforming growth factor-beta-induced protein